MWYPPQNNIALHSPELYCLHLAQAIRLRTLSFSFHFSSMCMKRIRMWMYESFIDVFYIDFLCLYACLLCSNLDMFHIILNSPKKIYKTDSNRFFAYHLVWNQIHSFFYKFVIVRLQLKFYMFLNQINWLKEGSFVETKVKTPNWTVFL